MPTRQDLEEARLLLKAHGYVTVKEGSYAAAQTRLAVAKHRAECESEAAAHARDWARDCLRESRRLMDRLTFVYGVARAFGASHDDLRGDCSECPAPAGEAHADGCRLGALPVVGERPLPNRGEVYARRLAHIAETVRALRDHPLVGVSGVTTEALQDADAAMRRAVTAVVDYPPVEIEPIRSGVPR